jgi:hypothetical protein
MSHNYIFEKPYLCYSAFWFPSASAAWSLPLPATKSAERFATFGRKFAAARPKIWNRQKRLFAPDNPLKFHNTAKGIFGKACRFQAKNLEMFGAGLEKFAGAACFT